MKKTESRTGNPLVRLFRMMWKCSEGSRHIVVLFWTMFMVAVSIDIFVKPQIWASMVNTIQTEKLTDDSVKTLLWLLALVVAVDVVYWGMHGPARVMECTNAYFAYMNYQKFLVKGVLAQSIEWSNEHHSGDTLDKIKKGTDAIYDFSGTSFNIIYGGMQLLGSLVMLGYLYPPAIAVVLAVVCIIIVMIVRFDRFLNKIYAKQSKMENVAAASITDAITNFTTVTILRIEQTMFEKIVKKIDEPFDAYKEGYRRNETKWFLTSMGCSVMTVAVLSMYFTQNKGAGVVAFGTIWLLIDYLRKISDQFYQFAELCGRVLRQNAKVANCEIIAQSFKERPTVAHALPRKWERLKVKGLSFSHHGDNGDLHLNNVELDILNGEKIAVIGESGGGKTTFLHLLRNLYRAKNLRLEVDGIHIPQGFGGVADAIGLIPQSPDIFATTIRENITFGLPHNEETLFHFIDMVDFTEVLERLPQGLESVAFERGVNLSGGQRQRLAIARALVAAKDAKILLLDEPTSSVGSKSGHEIYRKIMEEFAGRTIISTLHRLDLLHYFDRIFVFKEGKLVAAGSYQELEETSEVFQEMLRAGDPEVLA